MILSRAFRDYLPPASPKSFALYSGALTCRRYLSFPHLNRQVPRSGYATTREECEEKLKVLIVEMKKEIAEIKANAKNED